MTTVTHVFPYGAQAVMRGNLNLAANISVLLIDISSNPYTWNSTSQSHQYVTDILGGSGGGALTEVSTMGTNYARMALTGLSATASGLDVNVAAATATWSNATFTAQYAFFYGSTPTTDATRHVLGYWDFTSNIQPAVAAPFALDFTGGILLESVVT